MEQCTDYSIGVLITQYELGQLNEKDCDRFEEHLLNCDYCSKEIEKMELFTDSVCDNKEEILEKLHAQGISYEAERQKLLARRRHVQVKTPLMDQIFQYLQAFWQPKIYVPALVTTSLIILLFILPRTSQHPDNPYLTYLSFEKAPYQRLRTAVETEAQRFFTQGMEAYLKDDYIGAISHLARATELNPREGNWWLYLGVCYYLERQADPGIESLSIADSLTVNTMRNRAKWYLGQAYLLSGDARMAIPLLEELIGKEEEYSSEAFELFNKIKVLTEDPSFE